MKIAYVAGFFSPVLERLKGEAAAFLKERSVIWVPQRSDRQLDLNRLKSDLFDEASRGTKEALICIFVFRGQEHIVSVLKSISDAVSARHSGLVVTIVPFKNAQDSAGVVNLIKKFSPSRSVDFPIALDQLDTWAQEKWASKVLLLPRALRGAKQSIYLDVQLIYKGLTLLAEEYWAMRTCSQASASRCTGSFTNKLSELGLDLAPSISATRAGEEGEDYSVHYPIGGSLKRTLDLHLKKGSDRDARHCLRIYFFWDSASRASVVGWLSSHLGTRES